MSPNIKQNNEDPKTKHLSKLTHERLTTDKSLIINPPKDIPTKYSTDMHKFEKDKTWFHVMNHLEPHNVRRNKILKAHPEIKELYKKDTSSMYYTFTIVTFQFFMCYIIKTYCHSWWLWLLLTYNISAVANHSLFVLMHDITHFTCFKSIYKNQLLGIVSNLSQFFPNAVSFGRYHRDHHTYLGDEIYDPDIPTLMEIRTFKSPMRKLLFMFILPIFYAFRPYVKNPKIQTKMEILNIIAVVLVDIIIYITCGGKACLYLIFGTLWGLSIHPVGAHVIAEHYEFNKGQETYSYYGFINYLNFNLGYHVEHHDFPMISWRKLPLLRKIAPEFYEPLPKIDSYVKLMYKYIFETDLGPWSRVARVESNIVEDEEDKQNKDIACVDNPDNKKLN